MIIYTKTEDLGNGRVDVTTATIDPTNLGAIWKLERDGWVREE